MATKLSNKTVLKEHQLILDTKVTVAASIINLSGRASKGQNQIDIPTLAPRNGSAIAVGTSIPLVANNYGQDTMDLNQLVHGSFEVADHDEIDNIMDGMKDAVEQIQKDMAKQLDKFLVLALLAAATAASTLRFDATTPGANPSTSFYEDIVNISVDMDEALIPPEDRTLLVTPRDYGLLQLDARFMDYDKLGRENISNGVVGRILGFQVIRGNSAALTESIAYHKACAAFAWHANQVIKKQPNAADVKDLYSVSRKFGAEVLQSGALVYKFITN